MNPGNRRILYCHCAYARVVPGEVKHEVLAKLAESDLTFDAVPDLCEMSARRDPKLKELADGGAVQIAACYPRAVRGLFAAAGTPLPDQGVEVLNMREQSAAAIVHSILGVK
jgi:heterodisulfide reductase subunit A-like polyferredoxin